MRPLVYLSGPISGCTYYGCTSWREFATARLADIGAVGITPLRGKEYLAGAGVIGDLTGAALSNFMTQDKAIVTRDRWDTQRVDFVLMNLLGATQVSIGTMVELGWADAARVPVVLVMEPTGNVHEHCFVREMTGYRVDTLDEALHLLAAAFHQGDRHA